MESKNQQNQLQIKHEEIIPRPVAGSVPWGVFWGKGDLCYDFLGQLGCSCQLCKFCAHCLSSVIALAVVFRGLRGGFLL